MWISRGERNGLIVIAIFFEKQYESLRRFSFEKKRKEKNDDHDKNLPGFRFKYNRAEQHVATSWQFSRAALVTKQTRINHESDVFEVRNFDGFTTSIGTNTRNVLSNESLRLSFDPRLIHTRFLV